jgi:PTS system nitrogen regulatory IIA component
MNIKQLAAYLSMDARELHKLASRQKLPCRKTGGDFIFTKGEVDSWIWQKMHDFDSSEIRGIELGVSKHHGFDTDKPVICPLVHENAIALPLAARTRDAALRGLVDVADSAGLVYDREHLLGELKGREQLCSTAIIPGVAFPHPRHPLPHDIAESFVIPGLTPAGVPFGAEDGSLSRLFFFICCKDERTHLHVLARIVRMLDAVGFVDSLLECQSPRELKETLAHREIEIIGLRDEG